MERLDLNFRAESAPTPRGSLASGWWLWCLVGISIGLGCWWFSRQYLTRRLGDQLASAQSPSEAFLALEGLLMLDPNSSLEIARGLQHPNSQVARAAYRTLDAQITGWQQLDATHAAARMRSLTERLNELPKSTPLDNLVLASSLASRIFSICLELDDPQLAPVMVLCEAVFQRVGASQIARQASEQELQDLQQDIGQFQPPPPLAGTQFAIQSPEAPAFPVASLSGDFTTRNLSDEPPSFPTASLADNVTGEGMLDASTTGEAMGLVPSMLAREGFHSSTSSPTTAHVEFVNSGTRPRSASIADSGGASFSLSDEDAEVTGVAPGQSPEEALVEPIVRMRVLTRDIDLAHIEEMEIDQLVRLLGSEQPRVAQAAALALRAQNMPDDRLALASELATGSPEHRLRLIQEIAIRDDLDPRPWLLWMAEEGEPNVKQQAIASLASMSDLTVQRKLRQLLDAETNESVAQSIRQVLANRPVPPVR